MKHLVFTLAATLMTTLALGCTSVTAAQPVLAVDHPEANLFDETRDAKADLEAALAQGVAEDKVTLVAMGANWCHDSRALAGWFTKDEEFVTLLEDEFVVTYIDVAQKNRNIDIAQRFGYNEIVGTPTLFMVAPDGTVLNPDTAGTWRNSASRTKPEILAELQKALN